MFKRCISLILVLVTLVSFLPVPSRAVEANTDGTQVEFEATNDFGTLLTNSLEGSNQAQTASDANRICDVQIEDGFAWVEFVATEEARVVVAIYTEDGTQMLGSGTETVSPEETEVDIQIEIDAMPQYYSAGAYLLSAADNTPLSQEFRTQLYTKVVQDIKNSTVDDYDPERVLNLDDDRTTNFAVFGENTILLDSSVAVSVNGDVYTIENASDELKAMEPGDSFAQMQGGEMLIVKAAKVKVSGNTVIVTDDPNADLSDVFEVVKVEGQSDPDKVTWDDSTLDEALAVTSDTDPQSFYESADARKFEFEEKTGISLDYVFVKNKNTGITGKVSTSFSVGTKVYIAGKYRYISIKIDTVIALDISIALKLVNKEIPLAKFKCPLAPACNVVITPKLIFKASGKIAFKGSVKYTLCEIYDSDNENGWQDVSSSPKCEFETAISATLFLGVGIEGGLEILDDDIFKVSIEGQAGAEAKVKSKLQGLSSASAGSAHPCELCFAGTVSGKLECSTKLTLLGKDIIGGDTGNQGIKITYERSLFDFYYCADDEAWGFGTCPHIHYKVKLNILDSSQQPMKDITFRLYQDSQEITEVMLMDAEYNTSTGSIPATGEDGNAVFYLANGTYRLDILSNGKTLGKKTFTVQDTKKELPVSVSVDINKATLTIPQTEIKLALGQTTPLTAKFGTFYSLLDVTNACVWTSSDESVAKIDNGTIVPVSPGEAMVTASYTKDDKTYTAQCKVSVIVETIIASGTCGENLTWKLDDAGTLTISGTGEMTDYYSYLDELPPWYSYCSNITTIVIEEGATSIGVNAFYDCNMLTSVTIPDTVTIINGEAFSCCSNLTSITIPDSVVSIGGFAFSGCNSLTDITVATGNTAYHVDGKCLIETASKTLVHGTSASVIPVNGSVTAIGDGAFSRSDFINITIPDSVTSIGDGAFWECSSLTGIDLPDGLTNIGYSTFAFCRSLSSITIPDSVASIGGMAFECCTSLTSITIPEGVTSIDYDTFLGCDKLSTITIPNSVVSIRWNAFKGCTSLTDIYYSGTAEQWAQITIDSNNDCLTSATIHYNSGTASQAMAEALPVVDEPTTEPVQTEETVTEPIPVETEAATEPVPTETGTEEVREEATEEPTEEVTEETAESTVEVEPVSDRSWRLLPGGAEMSAGVAVKLAAFTGKESAKNGLRTVSFTGLEPGEDYALIVSLVAGSVEPGDLQYITQSTASDTGTLTITYIPRTAVNAIVQLYGIPTDRGITLDREYITMKAGSVGETLTATVTPARWADTLTWASSDETVLTVGADGSLTPVVPGTAYAIATVTHGKYTLSARCRVDVTEEMSNVAVTAVELGTSSVTTQLYRRSYVNFDIILLLEQNLPQVAAFSLEKESGDNGVAVTGARFADETVRSLFALEVKDDRTLVVIPTQAAIDAGKTVKSSYSSQVIVSVNGVEFRTSDSLTLKVKKDTPRLTAKALSFNSFYTGQTQAISITGGTVTGITGTMPDWLTLDNGKLTLTGTKTKASATLNLSVATEEWAIPATVKCKVSLSYKAPALKLNKTSLTFAQTHSKGINLTLKAGKQTPADLDVKDIQAWEGFVVENLDLDKGTFTLIPTGTVTSGKGTLTVSFHGTDSTLALPVKVSGKVPTVKFSKSSVKLNAATGDSVTLNITATPADLDLSQVSLSDPSGVLKVTQVDADGRFTLSTTDDTLAKTTYNLIATAPGGKTATLKVSTIATTPTLTAKSSGKIDLTYPQTGLSILPVLKNYSGSLENICYTLEIKKGKVWENAEFSDYFTQGEDGKLYQAPGFSLTSGTQCRITVHGQLPNSTTLSAPVLVKVSQTAIPLKLSKSNLTLNKALGEWATVTVTTSAKGYTLHTPEMELTDSKGLPTQELNLHYQDGKLRLAVNDATAYGQTYNLRLWVTPGKATTLRIKILTQSGSNITVSGKAKGSIDVIRDSSAIVITPTYKNWAGEMPLDKQVKITQAPDRKQYTRDVSESFTWQWLENGQLKLQKQPDANLEPGGKYRLELTAGGSKTATVALTVKSGTAKATVQAVTLYAQDTASQGQLRFTIPDTTLNTLEWVQVKGTRNQALFDVQPWGENQFALVRVPGSQPKSTRITLELFFRGNNTDKPNATVTLPVTIH